MVTPERLVRAVAARRFVPIEELRGVAGQRGPRGGPRGARRLRQIIQYVLIEHGSLSPVRIGAVLGFDQNTIRHSHKVVAEQLRREHPDFMRAHREVRAALQVLNEERENA